MSTVTSVRSKVAKDEAGKANRNLKSPTLSKWDLLLNVRGATERFYEGGNHLFCLKSPPRRDQSNSEMKGIHFKAPQQCIGAGAGRRRLIFVVHFATCQVLC